MKKIIVSMTSYPERIAYVEKVLDSIINQTIKPDKIILYLSLAQFSNQKILPDYSKYEQYGFEISWHDEDIGPHKKYYYVMQEHPDSIIITVDDDILYNNTMVEELLNYHNQYPKAVIARRAHLITCTTDEKIAPYSKWKIEYDGYIGTPRMDLLATGCAGVLYPPYIFDKEIFNKKVFLEYCKFADDMWLKVMEIYSNIPTVLAISSFEDNLIPGISDSGLHVTNNAQGGNDIQLNNIIKYYDDKMREKEFIKKRIFSDGDMMIVKNNHELLHELLEDILNRENILIYGAGKVGKELYYYLKGQGYGEYVKAFIVEDKNHNVSAIDNIPVEEYTEYINSSECIVIGLWYTKQEDIFNTLCSKGVTPYRIRKLSKMENIALQEKSVDIWENSSKYWEHRYEQVDNSGSGSYNHLARFKADILNKFVEEHGIIDVLEWGCGDGNQLSLAKYPRYIGIDVSKTAVNMCCQKYMGDDTKQFIWCGENEFHNTYKAELVLSLDVVYHLVEDDVYDIYMKRLFDSSTKYVCIYSSNYEKQIAPHVRCRKFTDYLKKNIKGWRLIQTIKNPYPYKEDDPNNTSWSDFYFFQKY